LVGLAITAATVSVLPVARVPIGEEFPLFPAFLSAVFILEWLTAFLLYIQFRMTRKPSVAVLAAAYLSMGLNRFLYSFATPGMLADTGMDSAGRQAAEVFWVFWQGGFPAGILLYLLTERFCQDRQVSARQMPQLSALLIGAVLLLSGSGLILSTHLYERISVLRDMDQALHMFLSGAGKAVWGIHAFALAALFVMTKGRTTVQLSLGMALLASFLGVSVIMAGGSRNMLGGYVVCLNSLIAAGMVLGTLYYEINRLYCVVLDKETRLQSLFSDHPDAVYSLDRERKRVEERMQYMAYYDALTYLPNRRLFTQLLQETIEREAGTGRTVAVMFFDLDRFKLVNDTLGHEAGDLLLKEVSARLLAVTKGGATVARMGGDEFAILVTAEKPEVNEMAERIREAVGEPYTIANEVLYVTASVGISLYPHHATEMNLLLQYADNAMDVAKEQGKNNVQFFGMMAKETALKRLSLENDLRQAIKRNELILHYQPLVHTESGEVIGVEALARWNHTKQGLIPPAVFIPVAEETGLIVPIGEWVLRTACAQNKAWQDAGLPKVRVAVNLSMVQFQQGDIVQTIRRVLQETGLDPKYLELEITETMAMRQVDSTIGKLKELKEMGLHISVDDFGTGYSSLNYLKKFPIDSVKVDRSFVHELTNDSDDAAIVTAIIAMAHSLQLEVIAEGVETEEQIAFLREMRCDEMQGYYFSKPVPAEEINILLTKAVAT